MDYRKMRMIYMHANALRLSAFDIQSGKINAREYIKLENTIIAALISTFDKRQFKIFVEPFYGPPPWCVAEDAPKRIEAAFKRSVLDFPVDSRTIFRAIRDILREWYWGFVSIDDRVGIFISGEMTIYFSGLSANEIETLIQNGLELVDCPERVEDDSLWVESNSDVPSG
jgi:hypothetical protein